MPINNLEKFWAGGFLYNPKTNSVFLHKRDNNTKFNPDSLAFFGGLNEKAETPKECFQRELLEETALQVALADIISLDEYLNEELATYRYVFYVISEAKKEDLVLGEGAGFDWFALDNIFAEKITSKTAKDLKTFLKKIKK